MPIFPNHCCIYLHIPKAAGTTLENALGLNNLYSKRPYEADWHILYGNGKDQFHNLWELDHAPVKFLKQFIHPQVWKDYYIFTFVRNPYDRLLSEYLYRLKVGENRFIYTSTISFEQFVKQLKSKWPLIQQFMDNQNNKKSMVDHHLISHFLPQSFLLQDTQNEINFIGKFEQMETDWLQIKPNLTNNHLINWKPITKNIKEVEELRDKYYTNELKQIVYNLYKSDFEYYD